jgi:hypothetical protein
VSFDPEFMNAMITRSPSFSKIQVSPDEQFDRMARLLRGTELDSLLFVGRYISWPPALMSYSVPRHHPSGGPDVFLVEGSQGRMFQTEIVADFSETEKSGASPESSYLVKISPGFSFRPDLSPDMRTMLAGLDIKDSNQPSLFRVIPQYRLLDGEVAYRLAKAWPGERRDIEFFRCKFSKSFE